MWPEIPNSKVGEPTWEVAGWYPLQGQWSEHDYLELSEMAPRLVEFTEGRIEVLKPPTVEHQLISGRLLDAFGKYLKERPIGMVLMAPLPTWIGEEKWRQPDIIVTLRETYPPPGEKYLRGADLIVEIVNEGKQSRERDFVTKMVDYAAGQVREYWIADPLEKTIHVYTLQGEHYREHGVAKPGEIADSLLLQGFFVSVDTVFKSGWVH